MDSYASSQSHGDPALEYHIACQIQALHAFIGHKLFTHEVVSQIHYELYRPSSSTSNHNETLERYKRSLSAIEEHRLNNEIRIYDYTGQVSTFFVRDQELNAFEADELFLIVDRWVSSVKTISFAPHRSRETAAYALQSKFDFLREEHRFRFWDQQKLKAMCFFLFGDCAACQDSRSPKPVSSKGTGVYDPKAGEKQKMSLGSEEMSPGKRARRPTSRYNANSERKKVCLVSRETDSQGVTVEVREVDPMYDMDEETRSVDMDPC